VSTLDHDNSLLSLAISDQSQRR